MAKREVEAWMIVDPDSATRIGCDADGRLYVYASREEAEHDWLIADPPPTIRRVKIVRLGGKKPAKKKGAKRGKAK